MLWSHEILIRNYCLHLEENKGTEKTGYFLRPIPTTVHLSMRSMECMNNFQCHKSGHFHTDFCSKTLVYQYLKYTDIKKLNFSISIGKCSRMYGWKTLKTLGPRGTWSLLIFLRSYDACPDREHSFLCHCPLSLQWPTVALSMVPWLQFSAGQRYM